MDEGARDLDEEGRRAFNVSRTGRASAAPRTSGCVRLETPGTLISSTSWRRGFDLRSLPLVKRKALLRKCAGGGTAALLGAFEKDGEALGRPGGRDGTRGHRGQESRTPYTSGRSDLWQKIRADKTGFRPSWLHRPQGQPGRVRGASPGGLRRGKLVYAGRAGSGFTGQMLKDVGDSFSPRDPPASVRWSRSRRRRRATG